MTTVVVGHDSNGVNDAEDQNYICEKLESAGYTVEKLDIAPGPFSSYSYGEHGENPSGKIGVYIMADSLVSVADYAFGAALGTSFKYAYFVIRGDCERSRMDSRSDFENNPIGRDSDCTSVCDHLAGMTYPQMNEKCKDKCFIVFGVTKEERAKELLKAMGGKTDDSGEGDAGSTAKECIQKLLTHWDGEAECYIRGKDMYINKIQEPESEYTLVLKEGENIIRDSLQITDVNPNTVNHLIVKWTEGTIDFKDEELIQRFGEIKSEVEAVKKVVKTETVTETVETGSTDTSSDTSSDDESSSEDSSSDTSSDDSSSDESTTETKTTTKTVVEEIPIDNYEDALKFANTEWNKIKRDNGHTVECQVRGSNRWQAGEWVNVVIPSFGENGFMYTTRVSQSNDGGDWNCNLSLADYPPGWGEEELESSEDEESEDEDTEDATDTDSDSDAAASE